MKPENKDLTTGKKQKKINQTKRISSLEVNPFTLPPALFFQFNFSDYKSVKLEIPVALVPVDLHPTIDSASSRCIIK